MNELSESISLKMIKVMDAVTAYENINAVIARSEGQSDSIENLLNARKFNADEEARVFIKTLSKIDLNEIDEPTLQAFCKDFVSGHGGEL